MKRLLFLVMLWSSLAVGCIELGQVLEQQQDLAQFNENEEPSVGTFVAITYHGKWVAGRITTILPGNKNDECVTHNDLYYTVALSEVDQKHEQKGVLSKLRLMRKIPE